ncbi:MAG: dipeptidase [Clostridia bacterium]|nr:dipeptidase [Clostridia bacterium]
MIIVDGHCDSLSVAFKEKISLDDTELMFNIKEAKKPYVQFLATFVNDDVEKSYQLASDILDNFDQQYNYLKEKYHLQLITKKDELETIEKNNQLGIVLTTENGVVIEKDVNNIAKLYNRGVRVMGITWNGDNLLGCGSATKHDTGLTNYGRDCIKLMNELGIIIDVSHTSYKTFYDILKIGEKVIATHSNAYCLRNHVRNLQDDQIIELAKRKGLIGICFYKDFLTDKKTATIEDIVAHIEYISHLVGDEYISLGSDFDGIKKDELPCGIEGVKDMGKIALALKEHDFSTNRIQKIMGGNYLNYLKENL